MSTNPEINLKDRDNMFLAKVAGEEVDFTTITPSIPVSDREKLLMKIDERIGAIESAEGEGGGSGEGGDSTGGEQFFLIRATIDDIEHTVTFDKIHLEIIEAYLAGKIIMIIDQSGNQYSIAQADHYNSLGYDEIQIKFTTAPVLWGTAIQTKVLDVYCDNNGVGSLDVMYAEAEAQSLPSSKSSDSGKILKVNGLGAAQWYTP